MDAYRIIKEAIQMCEEALISSYYVNIYLGKTNVRIKVVDVEEVKKIRDILKKIDVTSMPF